MIKITSNNSNQRKPSVESIDSEDVTPKVSTILSLVIGRMVLNPKASKL